MTQQNEGHVSILNPFAHTKQDYEKIKEFDFVIGELKEKRDKVRIEETYCTVGRGSSYLFRELKVIDIVQPFSNANYMNPFLSYCWRKISREREIC